MPDPSVWEDIRRAYEDHSIPTADIEKIYEVSKRRIHLRAVKDGWRRRPTIIEILRDKRAAREAATGAGPAAPAAGAPATGGPLPCAAPAPKRKLTPIAQRRAFVRRLYAVIDTKLTLLERRFAREMITFESGIGKSASAADNERDTRAIGTLIKNLEQVTDYDHGHEPGKAITGAAAKSAALASTQLADEADRIRRELGERLQRFVDTAQGGAP